MSLELLAALLFLGFFVALASGLWLLFQTPERRKVKRRLAALMEVQAKEGRVDAELIKRVGSLDQLLLKLPWSARIHTLTEQAGLDVSGAWLLSLSMACMVSSLVLAVAFRVPGLLIPIVVLASAFIPFGYLLYKRHVRLRRFEETFPEVMDMLARAVRAGYAFTSGLELIAKEMQDPVAREFQITYDQQNLGLPLRDALQNLAIRVPLPDVRIFVVLLQIQLESGGNLANMLDNLSNVVRERFKLIRQIRVYTAEGRMSMYVLLGLPPLAAVLFSMTNPDYIAPLFEDPLGRQMLVAGVVMQVIGFLVIRRIVQPKF